MAESIGALRAELSAGHAQFSADMRKARQAVETNAKGMAKGMETAKRSFDSGTSSLISFRMKAMAAMAASGLLVKTMIEMADEYTLLDNKLKLVTKSSAELTSVQDGLYRQALASHSSYSSSVDLYSRFAKATETLGVGQGELLRITETLNKAMIISGATQQEATNGIIQLSQGMASGVLRGEEFNSIMENGSRIARMLSDYLGVDIGTLREMAKEGKITSKVMMKAFSASAQKIDEEFSKMEPTISQTMTDLKTVFGRLVSDANKGAEGTKSIAGEIGNLAKTIDTNRSGIIELFTTVLSLAVRVIEALGNIGQSIRGWAAWKRGDLGFFEFAAMNAEELSKWLEKNDTKLGAINIKLEKARLEWVKWNNLAKQYPSTDPNSKFNTGRTAAAKKYNDILKERNTLMQKQAAIANTAPTVTPTKAKRELTDEEKKALKKAEDAITSFKKERDMIGLVTEEEKVRWEITNGAYKGFTAKQKDKLLLLAKEIDILAAASDQRKAGKDAVDDMSKELGLLRTVTNEEKVKWEVENGSYKDLAPAMQEKLIALARQLDTTKALIDEEKKRESNADQINQEIEALKVQAATFNLTATAAKLYEMSLNGATDEQLESAKVLMDDLEIKKQVAQVMEDIKTPLDDYAEKMRILNDLLAVGEINQGQYAEATERARKTLEDATKDENKMMEDLKQSIEGWGRDAADAIVDFALEGKGSFKDFADAVIKDMLRMIVYQNMIKPIMTGISNGGWLNTAIGFGTSLLGSFGGGSNQAALSAKGFKGSYSMMAHGSALRNGRITPFANGGIVNRPTLFPMANGAGLMGEAGAEAIMPLKRMANGDLGIQGGNSISINVPITMDGTKQMASELRREIELTCEKVIGRHS